ncbi:hypothetical protein C2845_PM15G04640 [Panicum miliaceum]|uniref:Response regulatory domain-containing protein n=1 Tax=Panicum miliaceum TaxID=4540 RepID=A0A3L6QBQ1_PANMI|nr:hypothetical protein C2845_PM15G04640 [Panicum miliaceum]
MAWRKHRIHRHHGYPHRAHGVWSRRPHPQPDWKAELGWRRGGGMTQHVVWVEGPSSNGRHVMAFTSPIEALKFLKDRKEDIDFALVAVNMKEMHGFEFLDISRELHKNLQVISIEGKRDDVFKSDNNFREGANKQKATQLMWTPFLQKKFLEALELLGEAATPKMIQVIMNVDSIDRNQVSVHLQKHRKKIEKELSKNTSAKKCSNGASSSQPNTSQYDPEIQSGNTSDEDMSWDQTESSNEIQAETSMIEAMRRALRLGAVFDESQLPNDPSGKQASEDNAKGAMGKCDSDKQVPSGIAQGRVVKLVTYSDSEGGEAL